jgi:Phage protein (N4 Gp49/phage Sf6 gene 66) family/RyR domain
MIDPRKGIAMTQPSVTITPAMVEAAIKSEHYYTAYDGAVGGIVHDGRKAVNPSITEGSSESQPEGVSPQASAGSDEPTLTTHTTICIDPSDPAFKSGQDLNHIPESLKLITICSITLQNGFTMQGISYCSSHEHFDIELGRKYAREDAIDRIYPLLHYELRSRMQFASNMNDTLGEALTRMLAYSLGNTEAFNQSDVKAIFNYMEAEDERIARIAHEVNRAWCQYQGDMSQNPWESAPDWQKKSAINGVKFHRENPDAGDSASHDSWMAEKIAAGWKHGYNKDENKKEHPCITEYANLPQAQQFKDRLFRTIVHAALGSHIV